MLPFRKVKPEYFSVIIKPDVNREKDGCHNVPKTQGKQAWTQGAQQAEQGQSSDIYYWSRQLELKSRLGSKP